MTESTPAASPTTLVPAVPAQGAPLAVCAFCDVSAPVPPPIGWSVSVERDARVWTCDGCLRGALRDIEGKLDGRPR